jgi:hypothetical protein
MRALPYYLSQMTLTLSPESTYKSSAVPSGPTGPEVDFLLLSVTHFLLLF